jgi:hypothetical protein
MADSSDAIARTPRGQFLSLIDPDQRSLHGTPGVTPRELALAGGRVAMHTRTCARSAHADVHDPHAAAAAAHTSQA